MSELHSTFTDFLADRDPVLARDFFELPHEAREAARLEILSYLAANKPANLGKVREILENVK